MRSSSISIAMATYNGEKYLEEQLASISEQTVPPNEIVICDDLSSDNTFAILKAFETKCAFHVRVIRNEKRLGYKRNFVKAAAHCGGDIVAFSDQDDIWLPTKLEVLRALFQSSDALSVTHDLSLFSTLTSETVPSYFRLLHTRGRSRSGNVKGCAMAFRRELIEIFGWPDAGSDWPHDNWIALTSAILRRRRFIDLPLIKHRLHENNVSAWIMPGSRMDLMFRQIAPRKQSDLELEDLVCAAVNERNVADVLHLAGSEKTNITVEFRTKLLSVLQRRRRLLDFRGSPRYQNTGSRLLASIAILAGGGYRGGEGVRGFVGDVLARKALQAR